MTAPSGENTAHRLRSVLSRYIIDSHSMELLVSDAVARAMGQRLSEHPFWRLESQITYVTEALSNLTAALERVERMANAQAGLPDRVADLNAALTRVEQLARAHIDDIGLLQCQLAKARTTREYEAAFAEAEPLVTVRIATFNRPAPLVERTLPSVLTQTYDRLEVIVVGDGCTDDTGERVDKLGDPRVRFINLPYRSPYPDEGRARWLVAGSPAMNFGTQIASGSWIAPLDDDDEFLPDHVEKLLRKARTGAFEMAYGNILRRTPDPSENAVLSSNPPRFEHFGFQAAIYMSCLRFMQYDARCWMLDESGDWNLCRRMMTAGVRIGWLDEVVSLYYPSLLWT